MTEPKSPESFEAILASLEAEVQRLERGELPLEDALTAFERGMGLAKQGEELLAAAERKVEVLISARNGKVVIEPFEGA